MTLGSHGDFDLHTRLKLEVGDLSDSFDRRVQVNDTLVDAHFVCVPCLRTLTIGGLSGGDSEVLGRKSDRTLEGDLAVGLVRSKVRSTSDDISSD